MLGFNFSSYKSGVARQLITYMIIFSSIITILMTGFQLFLDYRYDINLIDDQLSDIPQIHFKTLKASLWRSDTASIQAQLDGILQVQDIKYVAVLEKGKVLVSAGNKKSGKLITREYSLFYPYHGRKVNIGTFIVSASLEGVYKKLLDKAWVILISNAIKTFFVAGFMFLLYYRLNTRHLHHIAEYVHDIYKGKKDEFDEDLRLERSIGKYKHDELDTVVTAINKMRHNINELLEESHRSEDIFRSLATYSKGEGYESSLHRMLKLLVDIFHCRDAFIAEVNPDGVHARTLAAWIDGESVDNFDYVLENTPCHGVLNNENNIIQSDAANIYPNDTLLRDLNIESYFGFGLKADDGSIIGILAIMDNKKMNFESWMAPVWDVITIRAALELERVLANREIKRHREHLEDTVKKRSLELTNALIAAESANESKSDFLSSMSHELRTPLNAILGFAQMLKLDKNYFNQTQQDNVEEILDAGNHLLVLINDILDLSKIEAGKLEVSMEPVAVESLIDQCISLMEPIAADKSITIINNFSCTGCIVNADETRLKQVIINLLSNAVKFNRDKGLVTLSSTVIRRDTLRISISDQGIGIKAKDIAKLFNSFERLSNDSNVEGTGIGLVISQHLTSLMGGSIGVDSIVAEGSTFWIEIGIIQ